MIDILRVKRAVHYKSVGKKTSCCDHSNKATEKYYQVILLIKLQKLVLTFKSVDESL